MLKKLNILLCALSLTTISSHLSAVGPDAIKDTYNPLAPEFRHVSPIQGAMWWEGFVIQKYYEFGIQQPKANKSHWLPGADGPVRLIYGLFNIVQGSFGISQNPSYPAYHMSARTIGAIIATLEKDRLAEKHTLTVDIIEKVILNDPDFKQSIKLTREKYTETKDAKYDVSRMGPSFQTGKRIRKGAGFQRVRELSQAIVDTYKATTEIYPPYSVYSILTGFMYRKALSKNDFLDYFNILNRELETAVFPTEITSAPEEWLNSTFNMDSIVLTADILQVWQLKGEFKILRNEEITQEEMQFLANNLYEDAVYAQIIERYYNSRFPKMAQYATISYIKNDFADCVETMIRNLCNIILYAKETTSFNLSQAPEEKIDPAFVTYYQKNPSALNVEQTNAHTEWANIIENLPWVAYNQKVNAEGLSSTAPKDTNGYIILSQDVLAKLEKDGNKVKIANRWYIPIDGVNEKGFEVQPSIRNIIILLNRFFGLNLLNNINQVFLQDDFNALYLPILLSKFAALRENSFDKTTIDSNDYTDSEITILFNNFSLAIDKGHGELEVPIELQTIANISPVLLAYINKQPTLIATYLFVQLFSIYPLSVPQWGSIKNVPSFPFVYFLDLFNNDTRLELFEKLLPEKDIARPKISTQKHRNNLSIILLNILAQQADDVFFSRALSVIPRPIDKNTLEIIEDILRTSIKENKVYYVAEIYKFLKEKTGYEASDQEKLEIAAMLTLCPERDIQETGIDLFKILFEKKYPPTKQVALQTAKKALNNSDFVVSNLVGPGLCNILVNLDYNPAYQLATDIAYNKFNTIFTHEEGIGSFAKLFEKGYEPAFQRAAETATQAINNNKEADGLELLTVLVKYKYKPIYSSAYGEANKAINNPRDFIQKQGKQLREELIKKGYSPE